LQYFVEDGMDTALSEGRVLEMVVLLRRMQVGGGTEICVSSKPVPPGDKVLNAALLAHLRQLCTLALLTTCVYGHNLPSTDCSLYSPGHLPA
jgi:hypothetical protein